MKLRQNSKPNNIKSTLFFVSFKERKTFITLFLGRQKQLKPSLFSVTFGRAVVIVFNPAKVSLLSDKNDQVFRESGLCNCIFSITKKQQTDKNELKM